MKSLEQAMEKLNPVQRQVAQHNEGNAMLAAVAGSGKTETVAVFVLNQIEKIKQAPDRMLLSTFSRTGANEINDRLRKKYGVQIRSNKGKDGTRVGTLHSVSLEIVRDGSPWASYEVDARDKMKYKLKDLLGWGGGKGMKWEGHDLTEVQSFIADCKNALISPEQAQHSNRRFLTAFRRYEEERHLEGLLTFDDMTPAAVEYLATDTDALIAWQGRYDVVVLDEFQDTNIAQMVLARYLSAKSRVFLVVGDDDQLIYGFRGSKPEHMTGFAEEFNATIFRAEANYRSAPEILEVANKSIANNNPKRVEKTNRAQRKTSGMVEFNACADMDSEASLVAEQIKTMVLDGYEPKHFSVLYRTNAQSRAFEEAFIREKIPHIVVGGTSFYRRKEVADILAYLKLAVNNTDDTSFKRAVNRPFRYIGKVSIEKIEQYARSDGVSMMTTAWNYADNISLRQSRQVDSLQKFCRLVEEVSTMLAKHEANPDEPFDDGKPWSLSELLAFIIRKSGYEEWLVSDEGTDTSENSRLSNLRELVRTANRFKTADEMLDYIDNVERESKAKADDAKAVKLMTIHKSKGLEFPVVFLAGAAQGILPHARCEDVMDERRLFYVAVTRARDRLFVSCPLGAWVRDKLIQLDVSLFVGEAGLLEPDRLGSGQVF